MRTHTKPFVELAEWIGIFVVLCFVLNDWARNSSEATDISWMHKMIWKLKILHVLSNSIEILLKNQLHLISDFKLKL